jgi:anaerobic selenocysteine-containing dehydrogenase
MASAKTKMPNNYVDENGVRWRYSICHFCHLNCAVIIGADPKTEKIVEIRPNEELGTVLCNRFGPKGERAIKFHMHPDRVNHPLKRVGERGEDRWEQISYDQAISEIAKKLGELIDKHGPETLLSIEGTYRTDHLWARTRFFNLLGNPGNVVDPGTICWCWNYTVNMSMVGWPIESMFPPGSALASTMVVWGKRLCESYAPEGPLWRAVLSSLAREPEPMQLIQVDPVCTEESRKADIWLSPYPGTDLFMMLAWSNYIIEQNLYNEEFVKEWSNAVFLVRTDDTKILRSADISKDGNDEDFVVWDTKKNAVTIWNSNSGAYYDADVDPAMTGDFELTFADGKTYACRTVWDALVERLSEYTTEKASKLTGCPKRKIEEAAFLYATNGPACIGWGLGGGDFHGYNAAYSAIAKTILRILTANIDNPGGEYIGEPAGPDNAGDPVKKYPVRDAEMELSEMCLPDTRKKYLGNDQFRVMAWPGFEAIAKCYQKMFGINRPMLHQLLCAPPLAWQAIETGNPYPVTAAICWEANPLAWAPNTKRVYSALKKLELLVVVEFFKTPTAVLADYIIPGTDWMERPLLSTCEDSNDFVVAGDRGVAPIGERRTDYEFFRELGLKFGQAKYWPWETYEDVVAHRVERVPGLDYEKVVTAGIYKPQESQYYKYRNKLKNGQTRGFATPSRKAEIVPSVIQDLNYDPLPFYREPPESPISQPELAKRYPFRLTTSGRVSPQYHAEMRQIGYGMRSMNPYPMTFLNIDDGRDLGIRDGDWIWIETPRGRIRQVAHLGWDIQKGVVQVPPSWWYPELPSEEPWSQGVFESAANVLLDDSIESLDPMTANWWGRGLLCNIYPCFDARDRSDQVVTSDDLVSGDTFFDSQSKFLGSWEVSK